MAHAGDFNVVPTDFDIYLTTSWGEDVLLAPESCAAFSRLVDRGWLDAIRTIHQKERIHDAGLRLDHLLLSPSIAGRLSAAGVDRDVRGSEGASDHSRHR